MKDTLKVGDRARLEFKVPAEKTVPHLYPESDDFRAMPDVFATGFMVGLMEWCCMKVLESHLEPGEGSLGIHINVSHSGATVPGQVVTVEAECTAIAGRRVAFKVTAHDGVETIGAGSHERMVVPWQRFVSRVNDKAAVAGVAPIASCG
ncbi:thioesterase family protein [Hyphomicrobium sp. CS1GBMeth3]|uniref:thioesterase family protein n=1 Tax=Hyphomicrobium sp. CS1GBMeth3 TaxID=1892845 RepID=UPI0009308F88|nr:thioesterase family protein [Hyphomicrobium sp. CS1GBMeth3]